jgi:hypothetical protein
MDDKVEHPVKQYCRMKQTDFGIKIDLMEEQRPKCWFPDFTKLRARFICHGRKWWTAEKTFARENFDWRRNTKRAKGYAGRECLDSNDFQIAYSCGWDFRK